MFSSFYYRLCTLTVMLTVGSLFQLLLHVKAERLWSLATRSSTAERLSQTTSDLRFYPTLLRLRRVFSNVNETRSPWAHFPVGQHVFRRRRTSAVRQPCSRDTDSGVASRPRSVKPTRQRPPGRSLSRASLVTSPSVTSVTSWRQAVRSHEPAS